MRVRQTLSPPPAAALWNVPWSLERLNPARPLKHELLARRFLTTARFWRARETSGGEDSVPIEVAAAFARGRPVEVMVHPSFAQERQALLSDAWLERVGGAPLGPYLALSRH
jgi:hypothetical protein